MKDFDLSKMVMTCLVALGLGGGTLIKAAPAQAADLPSYITGEAAFLEHPPVQRRIVVEERFSAPPIERHVIERRVVVHRIDEGY